MLDRFRFTRLAKNQAGTSAPQPPYDLWRRRQHRAIRYRSYVLYSDGKFSFKNICPEPVPCILALFVPYADIPLTFEGFFDLFVNRCTQSKPMLNINFTDINI